MKVKAYICAEYQRWDKSYDYCVWPVDPGEGTRTVIEVRELEFDAPPIDILTGETIAAYRAEQQRIRAEMMGKVNALQQQIDEMLAIENKSEGAV